MVIIILYRCVLLIKNEGLWSEQLFTTPSRSYLIYYVTCFSGFRVGRKRQRRMGLQSIKTDDKNQL